MKMLCRFTMTPSKHSLGCVFVREVTKYFVGAKKTKQIPYFALSLKTSANSKKKERLGWIK